LANYRYTAAIWQCALTPKFKPEALNPSGAEIEFFRAGITGPGYDFVRTDP
jgi:hypothetical protein